MVDQAFFHCCCNYVLSSTSGRFSRVCLTVTPSVRPSETPFLSCENACFDFGRQEEWVEGGVGLGGGGGAWRGRSGEGKTKGGGTHQTFGVTKLVFLVHGHRE